MNYKLSDLAHILGVDLELNNNPEIHSIHFDSRLIIQAKNSLFFDFENDYSKSKKHCDDALQKGVSAIISSHKHDTKIPIIHHKNPVKALHKIAAHYRNQLSHCQFVGITGSNGKTIVKEWLYHLLQKEKICFRSPKSYNSQIGLPYSVVQIPEETEIAFIEAGISMPKEMQNLSEILKPHLGVFTHIGDAHSENFDSQEHIISEKTKLFQFSEIIVSLDNPSILNSLNKSAKIISFGNTENSDYKLLKTEILFNFTKLKIEFNQQKISFEIPFSDQGSIQNVLCCCATLIQLGFNPNNFLDRFKSLPHVEMRLESIQGVNNSLLINDAYNADLESIKLAINQLYSTKNKTKSLIMSDIHQTGNRQTRYKEVQELIDNPEIDKRYFVGEQWLKRKNDLNNKSYFFNSVNDLSKYFYIKPPKNESILIKGAREFELEKIVEQLSAKVNDTRLEINLEALTNNFKFFKNLVEPSTKILAMVKAFSYGSGSFEIAEHLIGLGVDYLGVAFVDEGVDLRKNNIQLPILVLNASNASIHQMIEYNLEPEVFRLEQLKQWKTVLQQAGKRLKIHLKIETGMNRLGFAENEIPALIEFLENEDSFEVVSAFSHLAVADNPEESQFTHQQIKTFNRLSTHIEKALNQGFFKHILNSSGIINYTDYQMDMVRLGIGMYGFIHPELENVLSLKSHVSQVHQIQEGESVGYNRRFKSDKNSRIATIPVGYGDGLNRHLGNGNSYVKIRGKKFTIVGDLCMDMLMVDLGNAYVNEGDEVIIFGEEPSITEIASTLNTIPYEIITGISQRVKRVYLK